MKFSGKMSFEIILQVTRNQGFTQSLEDTFLEKPQAGGGRKGGGGQFDSLGILGLKNRYTKTFRQTYVDKFYYKTFLFYQIIFKIWVFKKTVTILIFNSTCFTFFIIMSEFKFNSMQSFR